MGVLDLDMSPIIRETHDLELGLIATIQSPQFVYHSKAYLVSFCQNEIISS